MLCPYCKAGLLRADSVTIAIRRAGRILAGQILASQTLAAARPQAGGLAAVPPVARHRVQEQRDAAMEAVARARPDAFERGRIGAPNHFNAGACGVRQSGRVERVDPFQVCTNLVRDPLLSLR